MGLSLTNLFQRPYVNPDRQTPEGNAMMMKKQRQIPKENKKQGKMREVKDYNM